MGVERNKTADKAVREALTKQNLSALLPHMTEIVGYLKINFLNNIREVSLRHLDGLFLMDHKEELKQIF